MSETEFLSQVLEYAKLYRWRSAHFRPAQTARGWRTAVQGDGKGFPDCVFVKATKLIVAELKVGKNKVTDEQQDWLNHFAAAGIPAYVWYPTDWTEIESVLGPA
jgi:hypothetical protein